MQFFCNWSRNFGERNRLQVAEDMLDVAILSCSLQLIQRIHAVIAESRTELEPGLHIVITNSEYACDDASKRILKL